MPEPLVLDVYYSFRSPFCYLATPRLSSWQEKYNIKIRLRPILPLVVRKPQFFQKANSMMVDYHNMDAHRVAEHLGLPFPGRWADPDPVVVELVDGVQTMGQQQPYIFRLTYLGVLAEERGCGIQFAKEVSSLIWSTKDWHQGVQLAEAVERAGLDLVEMDQVIEREAARLREVVDANQDSLTAAGHWGVPVVVFNDEPFFGQDRLDMVLWRLKQHGLKEGNED
ncbi:hypothetical protein H2200_001706 [Cladophialophora chaetospira]|uniref:Glutathione S-transferase kappa n=1 Tax=Cladophialophora chaetospira TaxID=386627 RepID=A0AA38XLI2_9EURO|nr:hypothetical protein H2200_001706 [Cladophialophora chaetospira]